MIEVIHRDSKKIETIEAPLASTAGHWDHEPVQLKPETPEERDIEVRFHLRPLLKELGRK